LRGRRDELRFRAVREHGIRGIEELRRVRDTMESAALQMSANNGQTKVSRSACGEKVLSSERAEAGDHTGAGKPRECKAVLSCEFRSPIDIDVVSWTRRLGSLRCRDHHELLLDQELDPQPRPLLWCIHHSDVHDAFRHPTE
jgi:hypothetical protein